MKLTSDQKQAIKSHWKDSYILKFQDDGTVLGKTSKSGEYGILYNPKDTVAHLQAIGMLDK